MQSAHLARIFAARLGLFYGALFIIYGMFVPYFPVWLDGRGLSADEISVIMAAPLFLRLLATPAVALGADRSGHHRRYLIGLSWLSLALVLVLSGMSGFWLVLVFSVPLSLAFSTIMPLTETVAVSGVRHAGLDYGRMRLWGSLTFIAASFVGGFAIERWGSPAGIWLIVFGCAATVAAAHLLPRQKLAHEEPHADAAPWWKASEPLALLRQPAFAAFLVAAGCNHAAHATFLTFGTLIWHKQGLSGEWIGALWAIGVIAEVALFAVSGWLVRTFGAARLLIVGAASSVFRWILMGFDPGFALLLPLQVLHGATYGAAHIGAIHFIGRSVPPRAAGSAQALYATIASGVAMGVATLIAGRLYATNGAVSYLAMAILAAIALAAALHLHRIWKSDLIIE